VLTPSGEIPQKIFQFNLSTGSSLQMRLSDY